MLKEIPPIPRELEVLLLGKNDIKELPSDVFKSTNRSMLKYIDLSFNIFETLPKYILYSSALSKLEFLSFSHNKITYLQEEFFYSPYLQNLEKIDFSHNKIKDLPDELFHSPYLQNLRELNLSFNQIHSIPAKFLKHHALKNLVRVSLNNNNITSVMEDMFPAKLPNLCDINLANNKISSIGEILPKILQYMKHHFGCVRRHPCILCKLDFSNNSLTVQRTNFIQLNASEPHFFINATLDLSNNNISKFEVLSDFPKFLGSPFIPFITVSLKRKWLSISGNQPFSVKNLVQAALNIDLDQTDPFFGKSPYYFVKEILRLHVLIQAFPYDYDCNCDMLKYIKLRNMPFFKKSMAMYKFSLYYVDGWKRYSFLTTDNFIKRLKCGSPSHLKGTFLYNLKKWELQCEHSKCTNNEKCTCTETPYNSTFKINCTKIHIKCMPFIQQNSSKLQIYLGYNDIKQFPISNITFSMWVILLDLSYNYITNIPTTFFSNYPNITHLNLAGNRLMAIPPVKEWKNIKSLEFIEFGINDFTCNCTGLDLKDTLASLNKKATVDLNSIKCSSPLSVKGKVIYSLPDVSFGCPVVNLVLILTLTLSLLLFLSVAMFIAYVFRYYISLFLFIHFGWRFWYSYTKEETLYDAFISYSSKDSDWVIEQLVNPLENLNPPYHLCLHERDFLIGEPICDNIRKAVEGSKCTVCVVSKNWLESDWCQFEFRVAHGVASVEKQIRLLVILKEEIPKNKITGYLKFYMKTFTYLDSAHSLFWSRLLNDLPRPDVDNIREENEQRDVIELM